VPSETRDAVHRCIATRADPIRETREKAVAELARVVEDIVWERMDDRELAASLDGLQAPQVTADQESGCFLWRLASCSSRELCP
jgi:hypothetical protein